GGVVTSAPVAPTRTGYVFTGWFAASTGGSAISFPYTHGRTGSFTLYARWSQASLHGISSVSKIGTITTTANLGNTFAVDTESSSVSLRYPANGLPADTVIDIYLVNDLSRARSLIVPAGGFVVSLVVAWLAADGSVPLMASGKPLSMTIANDTIKAGAKTYAIVGGEVTLLGTAAVNGSVTISITEDPEIVIVNPVVVSQPSSSQPSSSQPSSSQPSSSQPSSSLPTAGVKKNPSKATNLLPHIPGATSKIAAILNTVAGQLPPKPTLFAPKILSNGQIARIAFTPIQIMAPPANAPVAPVGAKVFPIGAKIEQSQVTPTAPVSRVAAGESKATFGGQTIETEMSKSANGPAILSAGPATIALAGFADEPAASSDNTGGSTGLTASSSTPLEIATGSFIASTPVQVWLFSTPLLLAETTVDENGNFAAEINLPSSLASGSHTLQIQGYVYASGGAAEVTANIGISITRKTLKTWSTTFPMFSSAISARQKSTWQKFVADHKSPELSCVLTPTSPSSPSVANLQLFNKRMLNVTTFLKLSGCTNITTVESAPLTKNSNINRTWTVAIEPQTTNTTFNWVHVFSLYSSKVRKTATTTWTMNVAAHADKVLACRVTAVEPAKKSRANTKLFDQRNNAINTHLIENGCDTVEFMQSIASKEPFANRQAWMVRVSTIASRQPLS
ncbi:MAG: InlB B-repeat-containing protein, partial [Ilumatobacteraceae bacterium]